MRDTGGADPQSAFLRAVVVGPAETSPLTVDLDRTLRDAGHDVTLLTGATTVGAALDGGLRSDASRSEEPCSTGPRSGSARSDSARSGAATSWPQWVAPAPAPRAVPLLRWSRLDTWARTGRRLRGVDVIVLVHSGVRSIPALLALLHGAGATGSDHDRGRRPRMVLVAAAPLTRAGGANQPSPAGWDLGARLTAALVQRVDAVLVHDDEAAAVATELGADRVRVTARPVSRPEQPVGGPAGVLPGSSTGASATGARVMMGDVAREVRHGLAVGSRFASVGFTTYVMRQTHVPRLDLERTHPEPSPRRRTTTERGAAGLPTAGEPAVVRPGPPVGRIPDERPTVARGIDLDVDESAPDTALSAEWAHYVGVLESLASPVTSGFPVTARSDRGDGDVSGDGEEGHQGGGRGLAGLLAARLTAATTGARDLVEGRGVRPPPVPLPLQRGDLPDWVVPTDVLVDAADGDEAKVVARELGLPRVRDGAQAWSALGTLAAIIRIVDDGHRSAVVVDESGSRSPLTRWARAVGFAPVTLGLGGPHADLASVDLEIETLDVIARVHPGGCDVDDVDEIIGSSSWLLRPGGILVVTLPLGPADAPGAIAPADVRGVVARAHGFGFVLVGDLDGELSALMTAAAGTATSADTAYGLVRLTFRRQ